MSLLKKRLVLAFFLLLPSLSFSAGLPVTDIPRVIMEFIVEKVLMKNDEKIQRQKLQELLQILIEARKIRARHSEGLGMEEDLEKELRMIREVEHLKLHEVVRIAQKVMAVTNALYAHELPYLDEYHLLKNAFPGVESSNQVYEFMLGGTSLYSDLQGKAPRSFEDNARLLQEQAIKRYALEVDASQRVVHTALTYYRLSDDLLEQGVDLQEQVRKEGSWNLSGLGEIFSDVSQGLGVVTDILNVDISGLATHIKDWARDIKDELKLGDKPFLGDNKEDKSEQIKDKVTERMNGFDFEGLLNSVLGGISDWLPVPEYQVTIEKEGMRISTGERIETQNIALDNMTQAMELQLEADRILLETTEKSLHQQQVDASYENGLFRNSLTLYPLY